ncbi:MAG: TetR/AcrR family transcriptional regulator [Nocardioidaceae bacterium]|nr:TetR/AcrR family transcriptional regulator [Nocardioidaceae bacterium]
MVTPEDAHAAATRVYLAGERLDMRELAGELGISRNTLYRWTGGRDRLLQDVIWALSERAITDIWAGTSRRRGTSRLLEALRRYVETITASDALHAFLRNETHAALRLLTTRGPFQDRLVAEVRRLVEAEVERGTYTPRGDVGLLAYAVVRLIEGFVYNDTIVEREPAVDDALRVIRLLLE